MTVEDIHIQELLKELADITIEQMVCWQSFYDTINKIQASNKPRNGHLTDDQIVELLNLCKQKLEIRSVLQSRKLGIGEELALLQAGDIVRNADAIDLSCEKATKAIRAAIKEDKND
jgi:hypothetical protein